MNMTFIAKLRDSIGLLRGPDGSYLDLSEVGSTNGLVKGFEGRK